MEQVYLGFFSKMFDAVFEAIVKPVLSFLANLFKTILSWAFENLLKPLLIEIALPLLKGIVNMIGDIFSELWLYLYTVLLNLIDYLEHFFNIFSGLENVKYKGEDYTFLELLYAVSGVRTVIAILTITAFAILIGFSILSVVRSMANDSDQQGSPVIKVLHSTFRGFVKLLMVPLVCIFLITLSNAIVSSISSGIETIQAQNVMESGSTYKGSKTSISRVLFCVSSLDGARNAQSNVTTKLSERDPNIGIADSLRAPYYFVDYEDENGNSIIPGKQIKEGFWTNTDVVDRIKRDFDPKMLDYTIGYIVGAFMVLILASCCIKFIMRVFNVMLLALVSPLFAGYYPLDEGKKYDDWKNAFVGQLFMGFGSVLSMQIYLLITPFIMDTALTFGEGTVEANALIRLIFIIGGAFVVKSSGAIITGLLGTSATETENKADMAGSAVGTTVGGFALAKAKGGLSSVFSGKKKDDGSDQKKGEKDEKDGKFDKEKKDDKKDNKKEDKKEGKKEADKSGNDKKDDKKNDKKAAITTKEGGAAGAGASGSASEGGKSSAAGGEGKDTVLHQKKYFGGLLTRTYSADKKSSTFGMNLGKYFQFGMRQDGTYKSNILGIGVKRDSEGRNVGVRVGFLRFKQVRNEDGSVGKYKLSKIKISKGFKFRRAETVTVNDKGNVVTRKFGGMYCSDCSVIGLQKRFDAETNKVETISKLGKHYAKNADGKYIMTHRNFLISTSVYDIDKKGKYHVVKRKGFTSDRTYELDEETGERKVTSVKSFFGRSLYEYDAGEDDEDDDGDDASNDATPNQNNGAGAAKKNEGSNAGNGEE